MHLLAVVLSLFLGSSYTPPKSSGGGITALTGAVTGSGTGSVATTLATTQTGNHTFSGVLSTGSGPTTLTDAAGLVLGSAMNLADATHTGAVVGSSAAQTLAGTYSLTNPIDGVGFTVFNHTASATALNISYFGTPVLTVDTLHLRTTIGHGAYFAASGISSVSAAGSSQADCTQLTDNFTNVTTVGSGAGVCLPIQTNGAQFKVHNAGANTLTIYTAAGWSGTLNGQGTTAGITLSNVGGATPGTRVIDCYSSTVCFSGASIPDAN